MKFFSEEEFQNLSVGIPVVARVLKVDRRPLDDRNIAAFVMDERDGLY